MVNDFDWKRPHGMTTFLKFVLRVLTLSSGVECCMFRTNYSKGLGLPPKRTVRLTAWRCDAACRDPALRRVPQVQRPVAAEEVAAARRAWRRTQVQDMR